MPEEKSIVFIVDDDDSVRKSLERLIRSVGLDVKTFGSAYEFLEYPKSHDPSCLVLDIRMPGLSGFALLEELKKRNYFLPTIFITGHGDIPMSVHAMKEGAVEFLEKPFNDQALLDAVNNAIAQDIQTKKIQKKAYEMLNNIESLTPRETEVFKLVTKGLLNKQIACELGISEKTVKVHRARVMEKMHADSLAHLVRMAEKIDMLPLEIIQSKAASSTP